MTEWKTTVDNNNNNDNLFVVAGDIKALYPTISRSLVEKALTYVFNHFSHHSKAAAKSLMNLALFWLNKCGNAIQGRLFYSKHGNCYWQHSFCFAWEHHSPLSYFTYLWDHQQSCVIQKIHWWHHLAIIWRRQYYKNQRSSFSQICENELELSFRCVNTAKSRSCLEFWDVEHKIDNNHICGFYTRDFVKPPALDCTFLNRKSFHPTHIFKSPVFSEAVRLRRLNKTQSDYLALV